MNIFKWFKKPIPIKEPIKEEPIIDKKIEIFNIYEIEDENTPVKGSRRWFINNNEFRKDYTRLPKNTSLYISYYISNKHLPEIEDNSLKKYFFKVNEKIDKYIIIKYGIKDIGYIVDNGKWSSSDKSKVKNYSVYRPTNLILPECKLFLDCQADQFLFKNDEFLYYTDCPKYKNVHLYYRESDHMFKLDEVEYDLKTCEGYTNLISKIQELGYEAPRNILINFPKI